MSKPSLSPIAREIWQAGVTAVDSAALVTSAVRCLPAGLLLRDELFPWPTIRRILVLGCGKAGAGMTLGLERALANCPVPYHGCVLVPDDCVVETSRIELRGVRPAGDNFPTERGVQGARDLLEFARAADPRDLCILLVSGGGSALLPAPTPPLTLSDKLTLTRMLSAAGADIRQLNTVRKSLSDVKGGKLAAACRADRLVTLVISDILGDPLDLIASAPTMPDPTGSPRSTIGAARAILHRFGVLDGASDQAMAARVNAVWSAPHPASPRDYPQVRRYHVIGNNATAVDAAVRKAHQLGYQVTVVPPEPDGVTAESVGRRWSEMIVTAQCHAKSPLCFVGGGEPIVQLPPIEIRGLGGRNQQLVLAALDQCWGKPIRGRIAVLAGGTDGEDGPTDAAGAWWDEATCQIAQKRSLSPRPFLARCDAYHYFESLGTLLRTGPTHTNVCDLRIALIDPSAMMSV